MKSSRILAYVLVAVLTLPSTLMAAVVNQPGDYVSVSAPADVTTASGIYTDSSNHFYALLATGGGTINATTPITINVAGLTGFHGPIGGNTGGKLNFTDLTVNYNGVSNGVELHSGAILNVTGNYVANQTATTGGGTSAIFLDAGCVVTVGSFSSTSAGMGTFIYGVQNIGGTFIDNGTFTANLAATFNGFGVAQVNGGSTTLNGNVLITLSGNRAFGSNPDTSELDGLLAINGGSVVTYNANATINLNGTTQFALAVGKTGMLSDNAASTTTITATAANDVGAFSSGAGGLIKLSGTTNIKMSGSASMGFIARNGGTITDTGILNITNTDPTDMGMQLVGAGSTISATGGGTIASGGIGINLTGATETATLTGFTLTNTTNDLMQANGATGGIINLNNTTATAGGANVFNAINASTVTLNANNSTLTGDVEADATSTANINLLNNTTLTGAINGVGINTFIDPSTWNVTASSNMATLNNVGIINFLAPAGAMGPFKTVTVTGAYTGGGQINLNTYLNDGSTQLTDKLIAGSTAGATTIFIKNTGGPGGATGTGATNGIQVVNVTGGAGASNGTFVLGNRVVAGVYDYSLVKADGANYYLQTPSGAPTVNNVSPEVSTLAGLNTLGLMAGTTQLNTLQDRLGEFHRLDNVLLDASTAQGDAQDPKDVKDAKRMAAYEDEKSSDIWTRGFYSEDNLHTADFGGGRVDTGGTQLGGDRHFRDVFTAGDRLYLGGFAEYAYANQSPVGGQNKLNSYGGGLYATYYTGGWYADAVFKGDYNSYQSNIYGDQGLSTSGYGLATSLEGGHQFQLGQGWAVEPQLQLAYQYQKVDSLTDGFGRTYQYANPDSLNGRLGVKVEKAFVFNTTQRVTPWIRNSVTQEMLGSNHFSVDNTSLNTPYGGTSYVLDGGVTVNVTKNVDIYATGNLVVGSKENSTGVTGGVRVAW